LCDNSFRPDSFFANEYDKVFVSSLGKHPGYRKIVDFLSQKRLAKREEISKVLGLESGGGLSTLLVDLEQCGLISRYSPFSLGEKSKLCRFTVNDYYLQFYFKFINPIKRRITGGDFLTSPTSAIREDTYRKWLGYAFERYCRANSFAIAKLLGFSAVSYQAGAYFKRDGRENLQLDLCFDRADKVLTVCEVKYLNRAVGTEIVKPFERKLQQFPPHFKRSIEKVLIAVNGADKKLIGTGYFDRILTIDDIFSAAK
jgi:hypothetical protein